jgi:hypothetical protein
MPRIVLDTAVLDEHGEVPLAIVALDPSELVEVGVECEGAGGLERLAHPALNVRDEVLEAHAVDSVLETLAVSVVPATKG